MNIIKLRKHMRDCQQTETQNVLQHGISVARYYSDLKKHIVTGSPLKYEWKLPEWIEKCVLYEEKLIQNGLYERNSIQNYQIYHDCGKPFCITYDEDGRKHFPDHADKSRKIWLEVTGNTLEARLMSMDMDLHLMKPGQEAEFAKRPEAAILLITSLCELHSNAAMFGGTESTSFKIKWKN